MFTGNYRVFRWGVSAISAGKTCNICRDFPAICKYYRVFLADIEETPSNNPVIPCKHLQCISRSKRFGKFVHIVYLVTYRGLREVCARTK